jgi:hypothetical protein
MAYPVAMNKGEILRANGIEVKIQNQFTLKRDELGEYYEIDFIKQKILIDKDRIYDFLCYNDKTNNTRHILDWHFDTKFKFILATLPNGNDINLINYLSGDYDLIGSRMFNVMVIRNDQPFNYRSSNIMQKVKNSYKKSKIIDNASKFFNGEEIIVLNSYAGHKKEKGQTSYVERNRYRLITLAKERDNPNASKYYEVFLDKKGKNGDEFSFLIDEIDLGVLSSIRVKNPFYQKDNTNSEMDYTEVDETDETNSIEEDDIEFDSSTIKYNETTVKDEYITITNPTWHMYFNQYIAIPCNNIYKNKIINKTHYIHRYLLQDKLTDKEYTIDHINGNKFDNRRSNLRATTMSIQNMNRDMVKRKKTISTIINSFARSGIDTPAKFSFDNLEFIVYFCENVKTKRGITIRNGFSIEFKAARCGLSKNLEDSSTQANLFKDNQYFAIKVKLAHAISIRYLRINQYTKIMDHNIDNQKFADLTSFKTYSERLITEVMGQSYNIDSFLDYMKTLEIQKYTDPRKTIGNKYNNPINILNSTSNNNNDVIVENINDVVFNYIQYNKARYKYDVDIPYGKDTNGKVIRMKKSGLGISKDTITDADKKSFALVQRYNAIIDIQLEINKNINTKLDANSNNKLKSLADITLEGIKFKSFTEIRQHTETFINKLLSSNDTYVTYTLESFAEHITAKAANKKVNLEVAKID